MGLKKGKRNPGKRVGERKYEVSRSERSQGVGET